MRQALFVASLDRAFRWARHRFGLTYEVGSATKLAYLRHEIIHGQAEVHMYIHL